jgi:hypothetical protein
MIEFNGCDATVVPFIPLVILLNNPEVTVVYLIISSPIKI